ncbi:MAG: hypothetical protein JSU86_04055 [Phycisphaerales bacterium]|nr:MAG: hypothetical protein JSU86_04055 [Phycisphaerales bacterium]
MSVRAQCFLSVAVLCICTGCSRDDSKKDRDSSQGDALPAEDIDRPPKPNFTEPVDYLAWYSARNFDPDWPDGEQIYGEILAAAEDGTFPMPDGALKKQLSAAAKASWLADDKPELGRYLESLGPHLQSFAKAAEVDDVRWLYDAEFKSWWFDKWPLSEPTRILTKGTLAEAWMTGDSSPPRAGALLRAWRITFCDARHVEYRGGVIPFLLNVAARATIYESIVNALDETVLKGDDIKKTFDCMIKHDRPGDLAEAYRFDWMGVLAMLQELYSGGRFSDAAAKRLGQAEYLPPGGVSLPRPEKTAKRVDEWFLPFVRLAEKPWAIDAVKEAKALDGREKKIFRHNPILSLYLAPLSRTYELGLRCEGMRRGTILTLVIHVFREEHGRWPDTLDACGSDIKDVRVDPFSGEDFVYELRDGTPWLYSVGCDGKDDGGKHDPRWARRKPGHDYVFWPVPQTDSGS